MEMIGSVQVMQLSILKIAATVSRVASLLFGIFYSFS